jgi:hypothetical protein
MDYLLRMIIFNLMNSGKSFKPCSLIVCVWSEQKKKEEDGISLEDCSLLASPLDESKLRLFRRVEGETM